MSYSAHVAKIEKVYSHPNADRIQLATVFGKQIVVGLDAKPGDVGLYFPSDGQLSHEFCLANKLYRKHPETGESMGGYFESNRRVRIQKFRGEISDGFFCPISYLFFLGEPAPQEYPRVGDFINSYRGHVFCEKYIPDHIKNAGQRGGGAQGKKKSDPGSAYPTFKRVGDTEVLNYFIHKLDAGFVVISEKLHGTSGRTGYVKYLPPEEETGWFKKYAVQIWNRIKMATSVGEYQYISGTRRTVLVGNAYHDKDEYRHQAHDLFVNKLHKGEIVYYEIVGFDANGSPIQGAHSLKDFPRIAEHYDASSMVYSYGCEPGQSAVYVYSMGVITDDDVWVEYPWYKVEERCKEMDVKTVPVLYYDLFTKPLTDDTKASFMSLVQVLAAGSSTLDARHISEGVVVRHNDLRLKYKSDEFCMLEDIAKYSEKFFDPDEVA